MTMGFEDTAEVGMDIEETAEAVAWELRKNSRSSSLQNETVKTACNTATKTTKTGMQNIEEDEILEMKTRSWRKIDLFFAVELDGQD
jgi:hypothetical protein